MVSCLVTEDEGNRTSEEEIVSSSEGPGVSERVQMERRYQDRPQHRWFSVRKPCIFRTIILSYDKFRARLPFKVEFL